MSTYLMEHQQQVQQLSEAISSALKLETEIVDEVQSEMGRTGMIFGIDHYDVVPDIMTLGKAFGGGVMPIAAMVAGEKNGKTLEDNPFLLESSTFWGNPLCCAAAIAGTKTILEIQLRNMVNEKQF